MTAKTSHSHGEQWSTLLNNIAQCYNLLTQQHKAMFFFFFVEKRLFFSKLLTPSHNITLTTHLQYFGIAFCGKKRNQIYTNRDPMTLMRRASQSISFNRPTAKVPKTLEFEPQKSDFNDFCKHANNYIW